MRAKGLLSALAVLLICAACVPANPTRVREVEPLSVTCDRDSVPTHITAQGRWARLVAPIDVDLSVPHPMLVSLHPFMFGAEAWEDYSGLARAAAERGMWTLIPEGLDGGPRWSVPGGVASDVDDIGYIDALLHAASEQVCIDGDRVFAAGFSAGAAMAVGLSCELPGRFRAIAGSGGTNLTSLCPDADPVSALIMHGTDDGIVAPGGSDVIFSPPTGISTADVAHSFAQRNGCDARPAPQWRSATLSVTTYRCDEARLVDISVVGMGHIWAGATGLISWFAPPIDPAISANSMVLDFLASS